MKIKEFKLTNWGPKFLIHILIVLLQYKYFNLWFSQIVANLKWVADESLNSLVATPKSILSEVRLKYMLPQIKSMCVNII